MEEEVDEEGWLLVDNIRKESGDRYVTARDGDHLMLAFQCSVCHFQNLQGRNPRPDSPKDDLLLSHIDRCSMDGFWSREASTVRDHRRQAARVERTADKLGLGSMTPPMGPFPLEDSVGMRAALAVLDRSQDTSGKYGKYVQPNTYRKAQTVITNVTRAGVTGLGETVAAHDAAKVYISEVGTHTLWFQRFMEGLKRRTGEVVRQDKAITIEVLQAVMENLEKRWEDATTLEERHATAQRGVWYSNGFCAGLRGEEMMLIEYNGTRNSLEYLIPGACKDPHFFLAVTGPTKTDRKKGAAFKVPCCKTTEGSGLTPGLWIQRYVQTLEEMGRCDGYLFGREDGTRASLQEYHDVFYEPLEQVQLTHPTLIKPDVDVREEFGIRRSLRRGVTAHALNMEVPEELINTINRWRSKKDGKGKARRMIDLYAELEALIPTALKYSLAL